MGDRWGYGGPPPEAYSRVTNPERFQPIHQFTDGLLERLLGAFDVEVIEGAGLDPDLEVGDITRSPIRLVPKDGGAAPITFVFTGFPGVRARFGRWHREDFPNCGCDACDETAEGEFQRLEGIVEIVTAGGFKEAIVQDSEGVLWLEHGFDAADGSRSASGRMRLDGEEADRLVSESDAPYLDWKPWGFRDQVKDQG